MANVTERWAEFEFVDVVEDGMPHVLVRSFWPEPMVATEGRDMDEAVDMARDWLQVMVEDYEERGEPMPLPRSGNAPAHGGKVLRVGFNEVNAL
jgi:predicted RNase H-like HicB family nuclease